MEKVKGVHIYLSPVHSFFEIEEIGVRLNRKDPSAFISQEVIDGMSDESLRILNDSLAVSTIIRMSEEVVTELKNKTPGHWIVTRPVAEIQRGYVLHFANRGNISGLEDILSAEKERAEPRDQVISMVQQAIRRCKDKDKNITNIALRHIKVVNEASDEDLDAKFEEDDSLVF